MPTYWCANFDVYDVLRHGLKKNAWLAQYQYAHGGYEFQGRRGQKAMTTQTWKSFTNIDVGDWMLAYLPKNGFFAIGEICRPRKLKKTNAAILQWDRVDRTVREQSHLFLRGVVGYRDAPAVYEDFTDKWKLLLQPSGKKRPKHWKYAQRIDVDKWKHVFPEGIVMSGLATTAPLPAYRKPIFQIEESFFHAVADELRRFCAAKDGADGFA